MENSLKIYKLIAEKTTDGVIILDKNQHILFINDSLLKKLVITKKELLTKPLSKLFSQQSIEKIFNDAKNEVTVYEHLCLENYLFEVSVSIVEENTLLLLSDKNCRTQSKKIDNDSLVRSQIDSMNELTVWITHHWRQPLNVINLLSQEILDLYEYEELDQEKLTDSVNKINSHVLFLSKTLDDFSRFGHKQHEEDFFNVVGSLQQINKKIEISLSEEHIKYQFSFLGSLEEKLFIAGNENEFNQVVFQLIQNAIEAIQRKKELEDFIGKIRVSLLDRVDDIVITFRANGEVIKKKNIENIFAPYFTTKAKQRNSGLGLVFVRNVIEGNMGGKVYCKYNSKGSEFILTFPKLDR